jgi:anti-sigma regulatory factor (Ser/Thr protein kinase)
VKAVIRDRTHVIAFRSDLRKAVSACSFTPQQREEILLAVTEICTNLVRHGRGGIVEVALPTHQDPSLRIKSWNLSDEAPRLDGLDRDIALGQGLGIGLSSLDRLMDQVQVAWDGVWFEVLCEKHLDENRGG